jgi:hypothetical protein
MKNSFCSRCLPLYGAFAMKVPMLSVMQRVISIVIMTVIVVFGAVYAFYVAELLRLMRQLMDLATWLGRRMAHWASFMM